MSTKKEIWRLLDPGVDVWQEGDEFCTDAGNWVPSVTQGSIVLSTQCVGRRRMTLPEPQGWISVKERMPTKEDANKDGSVFWRDYKNELEQFVVRDWNTSRTLHATHWMSIPPTPEEPKDPDEEAFEKLWEEGGGGVCGKDAARSFFLAGRKSVMTEKEDGV